VREQVKLSMGRIASYDKELYRHALTNSDERAIVALILRMRNPRVAALLMLQYLTNNLKDECRGCSMCCKSEGCVDLDPEDVKRIADYLGMSKEDFLRQHTEECLGDTVFKYPQGAKGCVFLKDGRCSIYAVRPNTCVLYPFIGKHQSGYLRGETDSISMGIPDQCPSAQRANLIMAAIKRVLETETDPSID
jgi:Fe-S-cluster containining protein